MKLHRFYIGDTIPLGQTVIVEDETLIHQWKSVFKMKKGARLFLFNNLYNEYECELASLEKKSATFLLINSVQRQPSGTHITLCAALIKKDNFEFIVQKATELGVSMIIPILSARSEKKNTNRERLQKIAIEASEQCGRIDIPTIGEPISLSNALGGLTNNETILSFEPKGEPMNISLFQHTPLVICIGPEGGWTEEELVELQKRGHVISLPTAILRAETAAIASLTVAAVAQTNMQRR